MHLIGLEVTDFRSWPTARLELAPGVTSLVGPNGQGKTNLVEAIGYLATHASHRTATDQVLVRQGAESALLRGTVTNNERQILLELQVNPGRANRARVNRAPMPRPREALGFLRTVLFAPEDLALVKGDPAERRRFLDELIVARQPSLAAVRADYDRVLRQRNALLRSAGADARRARASRGSRVAAQVGAAAGTDDAAGVVGPGSEPATLEVWDSHLANYGALLLTQRLAALAELQPLVSDGYRQVSPAQEQVTLTYRSSVLGPLPELGDGSGQPSRATATGSTAAGRSAASGHDGLPTDRAGWEQALLTALAARRREELERGVTLVGPHRDDLEIRLADLPARGYASHGESWSLALALRLGSWRLLSAESLGGGDPVLILDDVFAELDTRRRERLAGLVRDAEQVLITAAVPEDVPQGLDGVRFRVDAGQVERVL